MFIHLEYRRPKSIESKSDSKLNMREAHSLSALVCDRRAVEYRVSLCLKFPLCAIRRKYMVPYIAHQSHQRLPG